MGSRDRESCERWDSRSVGLRKVNVEVGGRVGGSVGVDSAGCCGDGGGCNAARMEACEGSRREASMLEREG